MANFASALKEEISRIARKEIRQQTTGTAKSVAQCEREIAALKRQIHELQRKLSPPRAQAAPKPAKGKSTKAAPKGKPGSAADTPPAPAKKSASDTKSARSRFSAKGLKANRERLGLSADNYGKLVGVSGLSIYNWEQGKARPRESSIEALLKIRGIGKREAVKRLQALEESPSTAKTSAGAGGNRSKGAR